MLLISLHSLPMETVTQVDVTVPNSPNSLAVVSDALRSADVNIEALSCTQGTPNTTIHMVVDDPEAAKDALSSVGEVTLTDVLEFEMKNEVGAVGNAARALGSSEVNVQYLYASTPRKQGSTMVYVSVDSLPKAKEALMTWKDSGHRL